ncbi:glycosyl transferase family protein [Mesorhizobium sp. PUT5]|uniref:glycosyl transferase family protein n=1 Tax=Mesorhizobium sp. PUT5 TaxID=3454629 RepID=UPI003FA49D3B
MQTGTAPAAGLPEAGGQAPDEAPKRHLAGRGAAEQSGRYPAVEDASAAPASYLGRLRLLVALDCLLVEGSVGKAAARMGLSAAAMSRMLAQARGMFGDKLLVRSARGLIPTPRAETLRGRLRALAAEAEALLDAESPRVAGNAAAVAESWKRRPLVEAPPLAIRPSLLLDDQPSPEELARQLARLDAENDPRRRLAKYIAIIGRKAGNSRPLSLEEAQDAFSLILQGEADPMQIGALLRLLSYRGETAPEMAGIVRAARGEVQAATPAAPLADLDWPAYLSPRSLRTPWFLQAACLVAMAGHRVVLHGSYADDASGKLELACEALRIPVCLSLSEAEAALQHRRIAFLPLPAFSPKMAGLLSLYALFEARSAVNGAVHLLNPLNAPAALLGVAQPAYSELHRDTAMLLGYGELSVIGSSRDVAEWIPHRSVTIHRLVGGEPGDMRLKPFGAPRPQPRLPLSSHEYWRAVWNGTADDDRAVQIVEATAALALMTIAKAGPDRFGYWHDKAGQLWKNRVQWH